MERDFDLQFFSFVIISEALSEKYISRKTFSSVDFPFKRNSRSPYLTSYESFHNETKENRGPKNFEKENLVAPKSLKI